MGKGDIARGGLSLGGWTSANYAALACPDLPTCQGQWWPEQVDFAEGFVMWRGLGVDYEFGVLDAPARVAIHFTHRLGALATFLVLAGLALMIWGAGPAVSMRMACAAILITLAVQFSLGVTVVWFGLPLFLAASHNAVAALLLLSVINLNYCARRGGQ